MKKDIKPRNSKGRPHGYQEWYSMDKILHRGTFKDGNPIKYGEWHPMGRTNHGFCAVYMIR